MTAKKLLGWFCVIVGALIAMGALGRVLRVLGSWEQFQPTYQVGVGGFAFSILFAAGGLRLGTRLLRAAHAFSSLRWIAKGLGWFCTVMGVLICAGYPLAVLIDLIRASADGPRLLEFSMTAIIASEVLGAGLIWLGIWLLRTAKAIRVPARPDAP